MTVFASGLLLAASAWDFPVAPPAPGERLPEPVAAVRTAEGTAVIHAHNLAWNSKAGCLEAKIAIPDDLSGGNAGDVYFNRDKNHSNLRTEDFPGITRVSLDGEGAARGLDVDFPCMLFDHPVFGNCSRAMTEGPLWRSIPRALVTFECGRLSLMCRLYLANQLWVFPAVNDTPPLGRHGDVFMSVTPYWIVTQGKSWSDQYYLRAALEASRSFDAAVKKTIVERGLLAPTIQALVCKSLKGVDSEADYVTEKAHPTSFPPDGLDIARLKASARSMTVESIPPLAVISGLAASRTGYASKIPEVTYITPCAAALVLRGNEKTRSFLVRAGGGEEYAFAVVHGDPAAAEISRPSPDSAEISVDREKLRGSGRVDVAIFAKTQSSGWGAPAFVSFAVVDPGAAYSDPVLTGGQVP